jgi:hypothetical protein
MSAQMAVWSFRFDVFRSGVGDALLHLADYGNANSTQSWASNSKAFVRAVKFHGAFAPSAFSRFIHLRYAVSQSALNLTRVTASWTAT